MKAMGDNVPLFHRIEYVLDAGRRLADMDHQRQAKLAGQFAGHLQWPDAPIPHDDAAAANLDPTNYIAIAGNHAACSLYIDSTGPEELRDSIGGNKTDRTDVEKGLYRLALPVDHIFAKAVESRLAGRSGIRHGGDAARKASLIGPDREIATSIPDVNVKVGPSQAKHTRPRNQRSTRRHPAQRRPARCRRHGCLFAAPRNRGR
jgi:hypothetical protein